MTAAISVMRRHATLRFASSKIVSMIRLLPSRKQNLDLARDRSPTTAGLREEPDCADDGWQPYALIRMLRPPARHTGLTPCSIRSGS